MGYREEIPAKALELSPMERAELIESLFSSFEFPSRKEKNALWAQEAENRIDAFERGNIEAIPAKNIFEEIEKQNMRKNILGVATMHLSRAPQTRKFRLKNERR
ncbi:MAG TPA: addiction module protein [Smithellaceae bacterium]|nr:addiction module protein [Smithellaceae bacterium]